MQEAAAILTTLAMLVHGLVGCCWHHARAPGTSGIPVLAGEHQTCCDGHGEHAGDSSDSQLPHSDERDSAKCVVIAASPMVMQSPYDGGLPARLLLPYAAALAKPTAYIRDSGGLLQPPLTLFDLHQVLLI